MTTLGTGIFVTRREPVTYNHQILIGRRSDKNKRAPGIWALPGGMCDYGETITACARRELIEELGIDFETEIDEFGDELQDIMGVSDHRPREDHVTFWVHATHTHGEPVVTEPDKHDCWEWHSPEWVFENVPQVGEQVYWTNYKTWENVLSRIGITLYVGGLK